MALNNWIELLFKRFKEIYGYNNAKQIAQDKEPWHQALDGLSAEQIKKGLAICKEDISILVNPELFRDLCVNGKIANNSAPPKEYSSLEGLDGIERDKKLRELSDIEALKVLNTTEQYERFRAIGEYESFIALEQYKKNLPIQTEKKNKASPSNEYTKVYKSWNN